MFHSMGQLYSLSIIGTLMVVLIGCGSAPAQAPAKPPPQAEQQRTEAPKQQRREAPRLIAPPPAYGNKVVSAKISTTRSYN